MKKKNYIRHKTTKRINFGGIIIPEGTIIEVFEGLELEGVERVEEVDCINGTGTFEVNMSS